MAETAVMTTEQQERKAPSLSDITNNKKLAFLVAYEATGGSILAVQTATRISTANHYRWMREDPIYAEVFAQQHEKSTQILISEAIARATQGSAEPIMYQGKQVMDADGNPMYKYYKSDSLLMFLLKHRDPSFKDNFAHNIGIWSKNGQVNLHFNIPRPAGESIGKGKHKQAGEIIDVEAVEAKPSEGKK